MSRHYLYALFVTDPIIIVMTILFGAFSVLASFFDSQGKMQHRIAVTWSRILLRVGRISVEVEGLEQVDTSQSYVFVANHLSLIDTPAMLAHIPVDFRFIAKRSLFRIPFLGTHLKRAGHIPIVREDPRSAVKSMTEAARILRERRVSIMLFPEGSRSEGAMKAFKEGAAFIAIKAGVPVVPVGVMGTREILPSGSAYVRPGRIRLRLGAPIPTADLTVKDREALTRTIRERVGELIGQAGTVVAQA
jgi:1-acyl-sn-glycerol-3-phosphate acyltransferase